MSVRGSTHTHTSAGAHTHSHILLLCVPLERISLANAMNDTICMVSGCGLYPGQGLNLFSCWSFVMPVGVVCFASVCEVKQPERQY